MYATKILCGEKTIELRKSRPNIKIGHFILIYATLPTKAVIGFGKIKNIFSTTPYDMWEKHKESLGINKADFDNYFTDCKRAIGIEISSVCTFKNPILLQEIKKSYPKFSPPQTYKYFSWREILQFNRSIQFIN